MAWLRLLGENLLGESLGSSLHLYRLKLQMTHDQARVLHVKAQLMEKAETDWVMSHTTERRSG